jgi:hypothetical protein
MLTDNIVSRTNEEQLNTSRIRQDTISDSQSDTLNAEDNGIADVYYMYLRSVCSGLRSDDSNIVIVERCESYSEAGKSMFSLL